MKIEIDKAELKDAIREVVREELLNLAASLTPFVPEDEMKEIERTLKPDDLEDGEFVDGTKWLGR